MPVYSEHPEYSRHKEKWQLVEDVMNSEIDGYIIPPEYGSSRRVTKRNENYKKRAIFSNFTLNTRLGLVGLAMSQDPSVLLPTGLEYIRQSATGDALKFNQLVRNTLGKLVDYGRCGLRVDYPPIPAGTSLAVAAKIKPQAKMYLYTAKDIINWGVDCSSGVEVLNFLVLREKVYSRVDGYAWEQYYQYRVYQLDDNGDCFYFLTDHKEETKTDPFYPKFNGKNIQHIPFYIGGADDNNWDVDPSPMFPIAHVNIGHLRNSASLEDNADKHAQGTLITTTTHSNSQWQELTAQRPFVMGSGEGYNIGAPGSEATLLQLGPDQLSANMQAQKENQIIMLGGLMMKDGAATNAPVETTKMVMGSKLSRMETIVNNCEDMIELALKDCARFENVDPEGVQVLLNHDFIPHTADPQVMLQISADWQARGIPHSVMYDYYRKADLMPRDMTDEQIDAAISVSPPPVVDPKPNNFGSNTNGN